MSYLFKHGYKKGSLVCIPAATLCFLYLSSQAWAQGTVVMGRRQGFVSFWCEGDRGEGVTNGASDFTFSQRRFNEAVGIRGDLYVLDPAFVTVNYGSTFGLVQDRVSSSGQTMSGRGRLIAYDLEAEFLSGKNYSSKAYANRSHNIDSREFVGFVENRYQNQGAALFLKSFILPSTLSYVQEFSQQTFRFGDFLGRREYSTNLLTYEGRNRYGSHDVSAYYQLGDVQDHVLPELSFGSRTGYFMDRFRFGDELPKTLSSRLSHFRRGNELAFSSLILDEDLRIEHIESLSSGYHYLLSHFTSADGSATTSHTAAASLQHRLYQSLNTGLSVFGTLASHPAGEQKAVGLRGDTDYRKLLPGRGQLLASLGGRYEISDNQLQGNEVPVFQERHTARIGLPFRLDQPRAIRETVFVSGESGTIFQENLDYLVRLLGEFIEVEILPSGRIQEGESLLINYRVSVSPSITFSTKAVSSSVGLDYGWINPYYSYQRSHQVLLSGVSQGILDNFKANTAGIRFRRSGVKLSGGLTNEYHTQESLLLPYTSLQFGQFISYIPRRSFTLRFNFDEGFYHYKIPERKTATGIGRLAVGWSPSSITLDGFISVRIWRSTLTVDETFRDAGISAKWSAGKVTVTSLVSADLRQINRSVAHDFRWRADVTRRF